MSCARPFVLFLLWSMAIAGNTHAGGYSALYVFGGSLEDCGNHDQVNSRRPYCLPGRQTNGNVYVEILADSLGLPTLRPSSKGGTNYAWAGAMTDSALHRSPNRSSISRQVSDFIATLGEQGRADSTALYLLNCGNSEATQVALLRLDKEANQRHGRESASRMISFVEALADRGARHFAVKQMLDPTPFKPPAMQAELAAFIEAAGEVVQAYDAGMSVAVSLPGLNVMVVTSAAWIHLARREGLRFDYSYIAMGGASHPDEHFLISLEDPPYGDVSATAHRLLASSVLVAVNRPPEVTSPVADIEMVIGDAALERDLAVVFTDPDLDPLQYTGSTSDTSIAEVSITGQTLSVTPAGAGTATIRVTAKDPRTRNVAMTFAVTVVAGGYGATLDLDPAAENQGEMSLSGIKPGSLCGVQIFVSDVSGAEGIGVHVRYDGAQLVYSGFTPGDILGGIFAADTSGTLTIGSTPSGSANVSSGGLLGTVTFQATEAFSGSAVELRDGWITRDGRTELLSDSVSGRLSGQQCDFSGNGRVDFSDFLTFARGFGTQSGDASYSDQIDLDGDQKVDFSDFLLFAREYGTMVPADG